MNREERPIVFTISQVGSRYTLTPEITARQVLNTMVELSEFFNNKGYPVLFEVD